MNKTAEEYAEYYAHNYFDMHETNNYKALKQGYVHGFNKAKELYEPKWINVGEQEPPHNTELLVKSPNGTLHLCSWRAAYNIFTVQTKSESSYDWKWMLIKD